MPSYRVYWGEAENHILCLIGSNRRCPWLPARDQLWICGARGNYKTHLRSCDINRFQKCLSVSSLMYLLGSVYSIYEQPAFRLDIRRCYTKRPPAEPVAHWFSKFIRRSTQMPFPAPGSQRRFPHLGTLASVEGHGLLPRCFCIPFGRSFNSSGRVLHSSLISD